MLQKSLLFLFLSFGLMACKTQQQAKAPLAAIAAPKTYNLSGNEPFWNIVIESSAITFRMMGESPVVYPYQPPQKQGEVTVFKTSLNTDGQESVVEIRITNSSCSDTMSDEKFPYTVQVKKDGESLNGCGS